MSNKIIITNQAEFRAALQTNDKLFQSVLSLVEACDADHPLAFQTTCLPCVTTSRVNEFFSPVRPLAQYGF